MDLSINRWRVELSDEESESLDYEDFDDSLFSSFAARQTANAEHSRNPIQSSSSNITFRAYFPPWQPSTKLYNLKTRLITLSLPNTHVSHVVIVLIYNIQQKQNGNYMMKHFNIL